MSRASLRPSAPPPAAGAFQPAVPTSLWRDLWRLVRTPGSLVADRLRARSGESRFGLGEDRMIVRTLVDLLVWSIVGVFGAWMVFG